MGSIVINCGNCKHLRTGYDNGDTSADNCARYNMKLVFADDKACEGHDLVDASIGRGES